jgi:hypothetical protein
MVGVSIGAVARRFGRGVRVQDGLGLDVRDGCGVVDDIRCEVGKRLAV